LCDAVDAAHRVKRERISMRRVEPKNKISEAFDESQGRDDSGAKTIGPPCMVKVRKPFKQEKLRSAIGKWRCRLPVYTSIGSIIARGRHTAALRRHLNL